MKTNYEHYKEEIIKAMLNCESCDFKRKYILKTKYCYSDCDACSSCESKTKEWFNSEYKEPVTISKIEHIILNEVDNKWKYITRDEKGYLFLYETRPDKEERGWVVNVGEFHDFYAFNELFKFIKWEDNEPHLIDDLLRSEWYMRR